MNGEPTSRVQRRLRRVAAEYRKKGYDVQVHPGPDVLPPALHSLRPDLIAVSEDDRVIVEVKTQVSLGTSRNLPDLARVAKELGWRFELVVANPAPGRLADAEILPQKSILGRLEEAERLASEGHREAAFLLGWSALEGAARLALSHRASRMTASTVSLLKTLYSLGVIGRSDHNWLEKAADHRSRVVHGFKEAVPPHSLKKLRAIITDLIGQLQPEFESDGQDSV